MTQYGCGPTQAREKASTDIDLVLGGCLVTGIEDGARHRAMNALYSLQHLGYVIPPQADACCLGEAAPGPLIYLDEGPGGSFIRLCGGAHSTQSGFIDR